MGEKRLHKIAAIWSIYTPIDCGACTDEQAYRATKWVDKYIPHIPIRINEVGSRNLELGSDASQVESDDVRSTSTIKTSYSPTGEILPNSSFQIPPSIQTISTTNWLPYDWSTNNVAHEEVINMVLAYFKAGRYDSGYNLLMADLLDGQYLGQCPGNFGQISYYDKARSEAYRDFGDNVGISARAIINGLFGVQPDALNGKCVIQPAFPLEWDSVTFKTPYLSYQYIKDGNKIVFHITQNFTRPLQIVVRSSDGKGHFITVEGNKDKEQTIAFENEECRMTNEESFNAEHSSSKISSSKDSSLRDSSFFILHSSLKDFGLDDIPFAKKRTTMDLSKYFNANVDDIFKNEYLSPRSPYTTLEIPKQGIGQWCLPKRTANIEDDGLRAKVKNGLFDTGLNGLTFATPAEGKNIVYTSLWDNYPNSITIPLKGKAKYANLLLAGSTNNMQSRIDNGIIVATYQDGTTDTLHLENPINWCPIEQEYYVDEFAFRVGPQRPYRVHLGSGVVSRELLNEECRMKNEESSNAEHFSSKDSSSKDSSFFILHSSLKNPDSAEPMYIENGAAQILRMPLNEKKKLKEIKLRTLSNDVVIGLMAITLER